AFEPGREFLQGNGVVQGGIVTAMLDMTAAFAVLATLPDDRTAATASLTVSFLSAVRPGPLLATGLVERAGRRLIFARAQLESAPDGTLLATASVVMSVLEMRAERA
ncbi:MAG: PaaI family thioesterase, partial [Xanthobacteraceae bacterium]|nr:PaaI family thioesterase [Xanthobacteraceae bacterium]